MFNGMRDDAAHWMNYTETPSDCEVLRLKALVGDEDRANRLLKFGLRPVSVLDVEPCIQPSSPFGPFDIKDKHINGSMLVDVLTGCRFSYDRLSGSLVFDPGESNNYLDALELLAASASVKNNKLPFIHTGSAVGVFAIRDYLGYPPLEFRTGIDGSLNSIIGLLEEHFLGKYGVRRLWFRGQRKEYKLNRDPEITKYLYGRVSEPSLIPSLGRFVMNNPESAGFGLSFSANHNWKKPFIIWMILENSHWFASGSKHEELLHKVLSNSNDDVFAQLLVEIQVGSSMFGDMSVSENIEWPDAVDDLRQWFFAFMKRHEFGITLQQYGYPSSLLDVTDSLDVALYFTQSRMIDGRFYLELPKPGRVLYIFAERRTGDFFRHGKDLFWGDEDWSNTLPPRLSCQRAGFLMGSTCRAQNFYGQMLIAKIWLDDLSDVTRFSSDDLFPYNYDSLYKTLNAARPLLKELY